MELIYCASVGHGDNTVTCVQIGEEPEAANAVVRFETAWAVAQPGTRSARPEGLKSKTGDRKGPTAEAIVKQRTKIPTVDNLPLPFPPSSILAHTPSSVAANSQ